MSSVKHISDLVQNRPSNKNPVECHIGQDLDDARITVFRIVVRSKKNSSLMAFLDVNPAQHGTAAKTIEACRVSAAALAEYLAEKYDDSIDPDYIYKISLDAINQCMLQHAAAMNPRAH